jgi:hypothetical protein
MSMLDPAPALRPAAPVSTEDLVGLDGIVAAWRPEADAAIEGGAIRVRYVAAGLAAVAVAWTAMLLAAPHIHADPLVHRAALFGHLAAMVLGFGAVLTVDWFGLLYLLGRRSLAVVMETAHGAHPMIWLGLSGLAVTGALLSPHLSSRLTMVKLVAVLVVAVNGVLVGSLRQRMAPYADRTPPWSLMAAGAVSVLLSQGAWWTATLIGFINAQR